MTRTTKQNKDAIRHVASLIDVVRDVIRAEIDYYGNHTPDYQIILKKARFLSEVADNIISISCEAIAASDEVLRQAKGGV